MSIDFEQEHAEGHALWADGERTVAAQEDAGAFITSWQERYGFKDADHAVEALVEAQEYFRAVNGTDAHAAAVQALKFYRNWAMAVLSYKGPGLFALDCACYAVGWRDITGCQTQQQLADKWHCTKANVEKCVGAIQQICGIPKMVGQRSEEACGKMSKARKGQLTAKNKEARKA